MSTDERAPSTWPTVVRIGVARTTLTFIAGLLLWALVLLPLPGFSATVTSSGSMEPAITVGSVVVVRAPGPDTELLGRVVTVDDPARPGSHLTHRIVADHGDGTYTTRGDANGEDDSMLITRDDVVGRGFILVPWIGLPAVWMRNGDVLALVIAAAAIAMLVVAAREPDEEDERAPRRNGIRIAALTATTVAVALLVTVVALPPTTATFAARAENAGNSWRTSASTEILYTNRGSTPMFDATQDGPMPADVAVERLIDVTYTGTTPADIQLYFTGDPSLNNLIQFLRVTIERGTVSGGVFTPAGAPIFQGLMSELAWSHNHPYNGPIDTGWDPSGAAPQTQTFRVSVRLDPSAQGWAVPNEWARLSLTWFDMNLRGQPTMPSTANDGNTWRPT